MAHLIDKDALVAEIDKQKIGYNTDGKHSVEYNTVRNILDIIDNLEVKDADLDSNIRAYLTNHFNVYEDGVLQSKKSSQPLSTYDIIKVAKHFFELGLKAQKGEINMIKRIFPELKESKDEKIRKELIKVFEEKVRHCFEWKDGIPNNAVLAWLEKQGEQKPIETVNLWTIQDAKDGDVLACPIPKGYEDGEQIFIFKRINSRDYVDNCIEYYCRVCEGVFYENENGHGYIGTTSSPLHPATKEQRDLLFQKMHEAGYKWDAEKKKLKKIVVPIFHIGDKVRYKGHSCDGVITEITNTDYICGNAKIPISIQDKFELVEQNPAWTEEDEEEFQIAIDTLVKAGQHDSANWLKSIKPNNWKPSEEQLTDLYYAAKQLSETRPNLQILYNDLKNF